MDFRHPVRAVIPGAQGRLLEVLGRSGGELTQRQLARLAGISPSGAGPVLDRLDELGLVERRELGGSTLVQLVRESEAAAAILALVDLHDAILGRLREQAQRLRPAPASLTLFGSFARGDARADSDLDVLAVQARETQWHDDRWVDSLAAWTRFAGRLTGNRVDLLEVDLEELPKLVERPGSVWENIAAEGIVLRGRPLDELAARMGAA